MWGHAGLQTQATGPSPSLLSIRARGSTAASFSRATGTVNFCLDPILTLGREEGSKGPLLGSIGQGGLPVRKAPWRSIPVQEHEAAGNSAACAGGGKPS